MKKPARASLSQTPTPSTTFHPIVQAKLRIGAPDDEYEREADRVADQVMREQGLAVGSTLDSPDGPKAVQRKCAECDGSDNGLCSECEEELQRQALPITPLVQRKPAGSRVETDVAPIVNDVLSSKGQPLEPTTRAFFEDRFGHDFSATRIHSDARAAESARAVEARAYTVGPHVVFGTGQHTLATSTGMRLLAHELTHVVQQERAQMDPSGVMQRSPLVCSDKFPQEDKIYGGEATKETVGKRDLKLGEKADPTTLNSFHTRGLEDYPELKVILSDNNLSFDKEKPLEAKDCSPGPGLRFAYNPVANPIGLEAVEFCQKGDYLYFKFVCKAIEEKAPEGEEPSMSTITFHRWQNVIAVSNLGGFGSASKTLTALESAPGYDGVTGVYSVDTGKFLIVPSTRDEATLTLASGTTTPTANRNGSHPFLAEYLRLQEGGTNLARYAGFAIPKGPRVPTWKAPGSNIPLNREMGLGFSEDVPVDLRGKILEALKAEGIL
ncbi:MAG TPA: DUF4157 domain-containing protein [Terrimicrobiaceae bacterium]